MASSSPAYETFRSIQAVVQRKHDNPYAALSEIDQLVAHALRMAEPDAIPLGCQARTLATCYFANASSLAGGTVCKRCGAPVPKAQRI